MNLLQIHEPGATPDPHAEEQELAIGIDLGTTNTVAAIAGDKGPEVLRAADGAPLLPSVVHYRADGTVAVGDAALAALTEALENREALMEAETPAAVDEIGSRAAAAAVRCLADLGSAFASGDLDAADRLTTRMRYWRKLGEEVRAKRRLVEEAAT